ncbi:MAG: hypothetical protein AAF335_03760 [Bacteroidota bacterium]
MRTYFFAIITCLIAFFSPPALTKKKTKYKAQAPSPRKKYLVAL